eukprot:TRINITY_DN2527_c0_g1_i2.p1 TRINITY_DN2527_c0_g1~~TRINITY_DN2527_c0_g1_i2.p1  ORF type:complete len:268 (+),score=82.10 TRINITY_DN2527_c0_g1_i2:89-805(+)
MGNLCAPDKKEQAERPPRREVKTAEQASLQQPGAPGGRGNRRPVSPPAAAPAPAPAPAAGAALPAGTQVIKQRKICVLGKMKVGKSAICMHYVENRFPGYYEPTIHITFTRTLQYRGSDYQLTILDAAGQDELTSFAPQFSIGTHAYLLIFAIDDYHSFDIAHVIYDKVQDCNLDDVALVLVGNKADLDAQREVPREDAERLAASWGCPYVECSAKDVDQVNAVFHLALDEIIRRGLA